MNNSYGFEGDHGFVYIHAIISYSICVFAFILNALVFTLVRCSRKIDGFRYVFYTYCITNIMSATGLAIILTVKRRVRYPGNRLFILLSTRPQWIQSPGIAVFFPTGPFAHANITPSVMLMETHIFSFVVCLVCATFVYRYFVVVQQSTKTFRVRALISLTFSPAIMWFADRSMNTLPSAQRRSQLNYEFGERFSVNFEEIFMFCIETKTVDLNAMNMFGLVCTIIQLTVIIWTGVRMYRCIQKSAGSQRSKIMERSAFRLLLSQAINPMMLLHFPTFLNFIQSEIFPLPDMVNRVSCILMNFFSLTNPLFNIMLSENLKNTLRYRVLRRKKSSISIAQM